MNECINSHRHDLRLAHIALLNRDQFTHALTLNSDRELSAPQLRRIFGNFCMNVDRSMRRQQRVVKLESGSRFIAIAYPEHLTTNAHIHAVADLRPLHKSFPTHSDMKNELEAIWLKATRRSGSIWLADRESEGWARYMVKDADWSEPLYWLSTDFHPH